MLKEIFLNLFVTAICSVVVWLGKKLLVILASNKPSPVKHSRRTLSINFYVSLVILVVSLVVFCSVPPSYVAIKSASGIFAGLSFIVVWGAFEEAARFYPGNELVKPEPADQAPDKSREK